MNTDEAEMIAMKLADIFSPGVIPDDAKCIVAHCKNRPVQNMGDGDYFCEEHKLR